MFILLLILPALTSLPVPEALPASAAIGAPAPNEFLFAALPNVASSNVALPSISSPIFADALAASFEPTRAVVDAGEHSSPWYLRINAGAVTTQSSDGPSQDIDFKEGWLAAAAIGERVTSGEGPVNFALEIEGVWTQQDADDSDALDDVTTASAYLNGVFDFRLAERLSLYAGAGIGAAWMDVGTKSDSLHDFNDEDGPFLTWQLKAGLIWHLSPNLGLSVGYRFRNIDDNQIDNGIDNSSFDLKTEQHIAEVGLTFGW
jgi:opacity protein-like surface antigen